MSFAVVAVILSSGFQHTSAYTPAHRALSVRITSPLGRTGTAAMVRIVAQVVHEESAPLEPVRFFVDGVLVGTVESGPPFAVPWADENPFVRREITVQVGDTAGHTAEDKVVLEPYEILEESHVNSVLVEASVYDKKGRYVRNLDASRFLLTENGARQKIDLVQQESIPATFALLVDASQSMSRRMPFVRTAAARVVSYLNPNDRVLVIPFGTGLRAITGPTDDAATVSEAIGAIEAAGRTSIHDSLAATAKLLERVQGRKAVVLITDGYDETSTVTPESAMDAIKRTGATVYAIGIGGVSGMSMKGERFLREMAGVTGGGAFFPPTLEQLGEVYDTLAADVQNKYLITYTPADQTANGRWREIVLKAGDDQKVVQSRTGYQAPKPTPIRPSLEFAVTDLHQQYVDVTSDELVVLENGVEQKIETFQEAVTPVSVLLALDASGSMKKSVEAVKEAGRQLVAALRPEDSMAVIVFADKSLIAHAFADNRRWTLEAIDEYKPDGGTALYDALYDTLLYLKSRNGRRAAVVLTDGRDENNPGTAPGSKHTYEEVMQLLHEAEAAVFPVGLGTKIDQERLKQIARLSGGAAFFPLDPSVLAADYAKIVENLRRRFVLSYTSTNTTHDGTWRQVEIKSRRRDVSISARSGYYAPAR